MNYSIFMFAVLVAVCLLSISPQRADATLAAMAVDFGSQFMKIAVVKPGMPMEVALNRESRRKTPNIIGINNDERLFGDAAAAFAMKKPHLSYGHLINLLAKTNSSPSVQRHHKYFPHHDFTVHENRSVVTFNSEKDKKFTVEELTGMLLAEAKSIAELYADQKITDMVITVPPYFNQAQRRALAAAAKIANVNLLQLMNDNTAAGLNYGIFRRKEFNETDTKVLIIDMGATKSTATIFEYKLIKEKNMRVAEPQMSVVGVGYDPYLGGLDFTMRLRDYLADSFVQQHKLSLKDLQADRRAMAKLFKEAERVKSVLSANTDIYAQIESLFKDKDFRVKVTRAELEDMCLDLLDRVPSFVSNAFRMAEMTPDDMQTVIIVGGATRMHKVQEKLLSVLPGKELGKYLNQDEAVVLGAVYQAAHRSIGFKVLPFHIKDVNLYPIRVDFAKEATDPPHIVQRTVFDYRQYFPQKKVMTFGKHTSDFTVAVNYGDLPFHVKAVQMDDDFGSLNISSLNISGLTEAMKTHEGQEYKGAKLHLRIDESGLVNVVGADVQFEKAPSEADNEESTLSKLGKSITNFFGGGSANETDGEKKGKDDEPGTVNKEEGSKESTTTTEKPTTTEAPPATEPSAAEDTDSSTSAPNVSDSTTTTVPPPTTTTTAKPKEEPKPTISKINLSSKAKYLDAQDVEAEELAASRHRIRDFERLEKSRRDRDAAMNALESFIIDTRAKLQYDDDYLAVTSEDEREVILARVGEEATWLEDEAGVETETKEFKDRLKALEGNTTDIAFKLRERKDRPQAIESLENYLNYTTVFLTSMVNMSQGEDPVFSENDVKNFAKLGVESQEWWNKSKAELAETKSYEKPNVTTQQIIEKAYALKREVDYMMNKIKIKAARPKTTTTTTTTAAPDVSDHNATEPLEVGEETTEKKEEKGTGEEETTKSTDDTTTTEQEKEVTHDAQDL